MNHISSGKPTAPNGLTDRVPVVPRTFTIGQTHRYIADNISRFETIDYIYIVDDGGRLSDVISIKDMHRSAPESVVDAIHKKRPLVTATLSTDPEEIAYLAMKHGIKAVPLVDGDHKLIGVIPHDGITHIIHKELREDILRLAGVHHEPAPSIMSWKFRLSLCSGTACRGYLSEP